MKFLEKHGFSLILLAVISEMALPFVLALFYPGYQPLHQLISTFGENGSPVKLAFGIWEILNGSLFLLGTPTLYTQYRSLQPALAYLVALMVGLFGIGDCILTGLFERAATSSDIGLVSAIHNYASGIGLLALLTSQLLLWRLAYLEKDRLASHWLPPVILLSLLFMLLFAAPKLPLLDQLPTTYRGLWQRGMLFCLYLPLLITAVKNHPKKGRL